MTLAILEEQRQDNTATPVISLMIKLRGACDMLRGSFKSVEIDDFYCKDKEREQKFLRAVNFADFAVSLLNMKIFSVKLNGQLLTLLSYAF